MLNLHIFLLGMTGCGKTSLGRKLAQNLHLPFIRMDEQVEKMMGMPISKIKSNLGESFYHNAQTGVLIELISENPSIVSAASGIVLHKENIQLMQNHGLIIHVDTPLDTILSNSFSGGYAQIDRNDLIYEYEHTIGFYRACADYSFENDKNEEITITGITELLKSLFD